MATKKQVDERCAELGCAYTVDGSFAWGYDAHVDLPDGHITVAYQRHYEDQYWPEESASKSEVYNWILDALHMGIEACTEPNCEVCHED